MSMPRMSVAFSTASSGFSASFTPPALPRPPTLTCALTTTRPPCSSAAAAASSGFSTTVPMFTGTSCLAKSSFAWYSIRSTAFAHLVEGFAAGSTARADVPRAVLAESNAVGWVTATEGQAMDRRTLRDMSRAAISSPANLHVTSGEVSLAVREHSPAGADKPTVVLVHGYPDQQDTWDTLVAKLPL